MFEGKVSFGSSPRLWGTLLAASFSSYSIRFIPTAVGNASVVNEGAMGMSVHPHGCGERAIKQNRQRAEYGSSPRLWGTRANGRRELVHLRFIPTAVGNAILWRYKFNRTTVHPHGCGERNSPNCFLDRHRGSSPRLWGTPVDLRRRIIQSRFIPTAVGNAAVKSP